MGVMVRPSSYEEMVAAKSKHITATSYREFFDWNVKCIQKQPPKIYAWLYETSRMITSKNLLKMDMDGCSVLPIGAFFFSSTGKLILVNFT